MSRAPYPTTDLRWIEEKVTLVRFGRVTLRNETDPSIRGKDSGFTFREGGCRVMSTNTANFGLQLELRVRRLLRKIGGIVYTAVDSTSNSFKMLLVMWPRDVPTHFCLGEQGEQGGMPASSPLTGGARVRLCSTRLTSRALILNSTLGVIV